METWQEMMREPSMLGSGPARTDPSAARTDLLRLQKQLFRRQKALIERRVQGYSAAFKAYEARYARRIRRFERTATFEEVAAAATACDVVHVGDYHTLKQAQRWYLKLVRRLVEAGRPVVLALEFVEARHQALIDRFCAGRLSEATFLARTGLERRHGFDVWPNFKPIFEQARREGWRVVGLERATGASLEARDRFFARRIARTVVDHPGHVVVALTGQLHCAPPHLPREVEAALPGRTVRQLVVYQNAEPIWFELERRGLEHETEAVFLRPGEYCLVNTSPLVAQQSFLDWVDDGELVETTQPERTFKELARLIARFLGLKLDGALDEVEVYTSGDLSFLSRLHESGLFTARELAQVRRQILARESYYIPRAKIAFLAGLSMNHAAEEAAHFLRHVITGDMERPRAPIDAFYARALEEAFAFFGSKIVNPRRKTAHPEDLDKKARTDPPHGRRVARAVLAHLAIEAGGGPAGFARHFSHADAGLANDVTHALGYILGDRLYYAMVQGEVSKTEARRLFRLPMARPGEPMVIYFSLARRLAKVRVPRRT